MKSRQELVKPNGTFKILYKKNMGEYIGGKVYGWSTRPDLVKKCRLLISIYNNEDYSKG